MNKLIKKILVLSFSIILLLPNSTSNAVELNTFDQKGNVTKKETFTGHKEPMYSASGNAYVKSTNILFPTVYYNGNFSNLMYSSANTSRAITYNINTDNEETVRVGFKNVVIITVADEYAYIPDASALVDR